MISFSDTKNVQIVQIEKFEYTMVFKHLQSCGNLARTIRIGTLYFTISISTMSNACSYPSVRFPSRLVGWETDLDCNVGLWASRADDVVSFASLSGPEATRACTFTHNPIASASSLFEHIHRVNISFTLLFSKTVFQFYNWPDVLANPAWPWNFLRMNSKRTKCSQLWAERVRISLASLSGSGGAGAMHVYQALSAQRFTQLLAATALLLSFCIDSTSAQLFGDTDKDLISSLSRFRGSNQTPRIYRQCLLSMPPSFNGCAS